MHKVKRHKQKNGIFAFIGETICPQLWGARKTTKRWDEVTCKNCLKMRKGR